MIRFTDTALMRGLTDFRTTCFSRGNLELSPRPIQRILLVFEFELVHNDLFEY
jgi:hypothetical protein